MKLNPRPFSKSTRAFSRFSLRGLKTLSVYFSKHEKYSSPSHIYKKIVKTQKKVTLSPLLFFFIFDHHEFNITSSSFVYLLFLKLFLSFWKENLVCHNLFLLKFDIKTLYRSFIFIWLFLKL